METIVRRVRVRSEPSDAPVAMPRLDEILFVLFVGWAIFGLFLDGWAHRHDKPESFFSPWHGVLYSGVGLAFASVMALDFLRARRGQVVRIAGDGLTTLGGAVFVAGVAGDFAWHSAFGIEEGVDALLSPTHLMLMIGGVLAGSWPLRAAWAADPDRTPSFRRFWPRVASLSITTALIAFFFMYASGFADGPLFEAPAAHERDRLDDLYAASWMMAVLVTTTLLVSPVLLLLRRWEPPRGSVLFLFTTVALLMSVLDSGDHVLLVLAAVIAGLVAEAVLAYRWSTPRARARALGIVVPVALWATWFPLFSLLYEPVWQAELIGAALVLAPMLGVGLALLAFPPAAAADADDTAEPAAATGPAQPPPRS